MLRRVLLGLLFVAFASPVLAEDVSHVAQLGLFGGTGHFGSVSRLDRDDHSGRVAVTIDISTQTMAVLVNGRSMYNFDVSTGRVGHTTPTGHYAPIRMYEKYASKKYDNAPMPWAIFFHGGFAIHGTTDIKHLGKIASHGCVRLHPDNAKILYGLVQQYGSENTTIDLIRS